jgi:hypothetical protein
MRRNLPNPQVISRLGFIRGKSDLNKKMAAGQENPQP